MREREKVSEWTRKLKRITLMILMIFNENNFYSVPLYVLDEFRILPHISFVKSYFKALFHRVKLILLKATL